jgi:molybdenum cofactor synthesis domain-containing protein
LLPGKMARTAGIVVIGDEILSGKFADENAPFLIGELRRLGVDLRRIAVIPDVLEEIASTVREFSDRYDFVFTSGGVGPTHDDLTMEGIAAGFETAVIIEPKLEQVLRQFYGEAMPEANVRLAEIPEGADLIYGDSKHWPVVCYRNVYILPGVPSLFRRKFLGMRDRFRGDAVHERRLYLNADEGQIAPVLGEVSDAFPGVSIGSYPRFEETAFKVIVTIEGEDGDAVAAATETLGERLAELIVEAPEVESGSGSGSESESESESGSGSESEAEAEAESEAE